MPSRLIKKLDVSDDKIQALIKSGVDAREAAQLLEIVNGDLKAAVTLCMFHWLFFTYK